MKKVISILAFLSVVGIFSVSAQCCNSAKKNISTENCCSEKQTNASVKAYYFHATRRCATCQAVEKVSKETISNNYNGKVYFESINREEDKKNPLVKKYKVSGQTLLLVKGDEVVNLTNVAFLNARNNPEKFEKVLKEKIDSML